VYLTSPLKGFPLELGTDANGQKTRMMSHWSRKFMFNRSDTRDGHVSKRTRDDSKDRAYA